MTRAEMIVRLQSIATQAVEAQTASEEVGTGGEPEMSALEDLVADIELDLDAVNSYLSELRRREEDAAFRARSAGGS